MTANNGKIKIGIIGGSGLDDPKILENFEEKEMDTPYGRPSSIVTSGKIGEKEVFIIARHNKGHTIPPSKVPFKANIWALKDLGCTHVLATSACGSLREDIKPRDFVILDQFIDFTKRRDLSFYDSFEGGIVHASVAEPFCHNLRNVLFESAKELGISCHGEGTIITIEGNRFSTKAESRLFREWGADVVNMSTVPEVTLARELGICYAKFAMATDYDCWHESEKPVTWPMVLEVMKNNSENAKNLLVEAVSRIDFSDCGCCK